jgi:hypothetical protein
VPLKSTLKIQSHGTNAGEGMGASASAAAASPHSAQETTRDSIASAAAGSPHSAQETKRDTIASAAAASPHSAQETKRDTIASAAAVSPHSAQETKRDTIGSIAIEGVAATTPAGEEAKSVGCDFCDLQFTKAEKPGPLAAHCGVLGPASSDGIMKTQSLGTIAGEGMGTSASAAAVSPHSAQERETKRDKGWGAITAAMKALAVEGAAATPPAVEEAKSVMGDFGDLQFSEAEKKPGPLAAHCGVRGPASSEGTMAEALASSRWLAKLLDMREAARGVPGSDPTMLQLEADIVAAVKFDEQFSHVHAAVASRRAALKVDEQFSHIVAEDAVASKAAQQKRRKRRPG